MYKEKIVMWEKKNGKIYLRIKKKTFTVREVHGQMDILTICQVRTKNYNTNNSVLTSLRIVIKTYTVLRTSIYEKRSNFTEIFRE